MKKKLIPLYREKEIYTLFYHTEENKIYKFPHRNKSAFAYIGLFLLVLYGSRVLNDLYQPYKSFLLNIVLFLAIVVLSYIIATFFLNNYYIPNMDRDVFYDEESMKSFASKGLKQFRTEVGLGLGFGLLMVIIGFPLFILFGQIELLVVGALGLVPIYILLLMRPFKRNSVLKMFLNKKIKL